MPLYLYDLICTYFFFQPEKAPDSFDAKRQCLEALQRWNLEIGDTNVFDKENASRGTVRPGDQQTTLDTNVFGLKTKVSF